MKQYEIWAAGYLATGMEGIPSKPALIGRQYADSFNDACDLYCKNLDPNKYGKYDSCRKTLWALKLCPSYSEALEHTPKEN